MTNHYVGIATISAALLLGVTAAVGAHGAEEGDAFAKATARAINTDFSFCEQRGASDPSTLNQVSLSLDDVAESLHGVWVGMRYRPEGVVDNADYVMSINMEDLEQFVYEERGSGVPSNAFARHFESQVRSPDATRLTYLYCGGNEFGVFKDVFTKVSDNPDDLLKPLRLVTGVQAIEADPQAPKQFTSYGPLWESLKEVNYFETRAKVDTQLNVALNTISLLPYKYGEQGNVGVRMDFVGQRRGSPNKGYTPGVPMANAEGGIFAGLATQDGVFLDSFENGLFAACTAILPAWDGSDKPILSADVPTPFDHFRYDQVVIGPLR